MNRRILSSVFLLIALVILALPHLNFTGAFVEKLEAGYNILLLLALTSFIASVFLFISRKSLDAIVIPTGTWEADIDRTKKALSERDKLEDNGYFLISGYKGEGTEGMRKGQVYRIYKYLRDNGVVPGDIRIEGKSHDTRENVLYVLKKMKELEEKTGRERPLNIAFVSSSAHIKRFEDFYEEAVKRGLINKKDFRFHKIKTEGEGEEKRYERSLPRELLHYYKLRTMGKYKAKDGSIKYAHGDDFFVNIIRGIEKIVKGKS